MIIKYPPPPKILCWSLTVPMQLSQGPSLYVSCSAAHEGCSGGHNTVTLSSQDQEDLRPCSSPGEPQHTHTHTHTHAHTHANLKSDIVGSVTRVLIVQFQRFSNFLNAQKEPVQMVCSIIIFIFGTGHNFSFSGKDRVNCSL